jgi:hypothetical protein
VLGNGSAFGVDVPPRPTPASVVSRAGVVVVCGWALAQPAIAPASRRQSRARM